MNKESSGLVKLLYAEWYRASALLTMQTAIEEGDYWWAMERQFEYLYWQDEFIELLKKNHDEYLALRVAVVGVKWK